MESKIEYYRKKYKRAEKVLIAVTVALLFFSFYFYITMTEVPVINYLSYNFADERIRDTPIIEEIAENISEFCESLDLGNRSTEKCIITQSVRESYRWLELGQNESFLDDKLWINKEPSYTLRNRTDCQGQAIFIADLLVLNNITQIHYVSQTDENGGHICLLVNTEYNQEFVNCIKDMELTSVRRVLKNASKT